MTKTASKNQILFARLVVVLMIAFAVAGASGTGTRRGPPSRLAETDRPSRGTDAFRFVLQPIMAAIAALHDGIEDASRALALYLDAAQQSVGTRRPPEGRGDFHRAGHSSRAVHGHNLSANRAQDILSRRAVIVAIALGFIPYLLLRGPIERIARWRLAVRPLMEVGDGLDRSLSRLKSRRYRARQCCALPFGRVYVRCRGRSN